ncbi:hypothetical protein HD806DRAFT_550059 [Xylariaceae sp. AK1471]|nr:hypothetical protein HD806DRAFT_550059 [Xylariaceae sp. AK1471]
MLWASKRQTQRKEDRAYCLQGIFYVYIPLIYGEGENAFVRLEEEIKNQARRQTRSNKVWRSIYGVTLSGYQDTNDQLIQAGYRLSCLSCYTSDDELRFAAIWTRNSATHWAARHGMIVDEYKRLSDSLVADGFRLNLINGYTSNGESRYAAIWDKSPSKGWVSEFDMTSSQYQEVFDTYCSQGYRLRHVGAHARDGEARYAAIWDKPETDVAWVSHHSMTSYGYQTMFDKYLNQGFRLVHVHG